MTDTSDAAIGWRRNLAAVLSLPLDLTQLQQGVFRQAIKQRKHPLQCLLLQTPLSSTESPSIISMQGRGAGVGVLALDAVAASVAAV